MDPVCYFPEPFGDGTNRRRWHYIHKYFLSLGEHINPDIVFFGDCLFENKSDMLQCDKFFGQMNCVYFCIRDDKIENIHWRIIRNELRNLEPSVIVLSIGKNNTTNTPSVIANAIIRCVSTLRSKMPTAEIIVPSLITKVKRSTRERRRDQSINAFVKVRAARLSRVHTVNILRKPERGHNPRVASKNFESLYLKVKSLCNLVA